MTRRTSADLTALAAAPTLRLHNTASDRSAAAWVVRLGRDLYVRPAPDTGLSWLNFALAAGVRATAGRHHVTLTEVAPEVHGPLDQAYTAKYGRCGGERVADATSEEAARATYRLQHRRAGVAELSSTALRALTGAVGQRRSARRPAPRAVGPAAPCMAR